MRLIVLLLLISELAFSQNQQMLMRTKVAAAPSFSPDDISNLKIWYDGADIDGDGLQEGTSESGLSGTTVTNLIDKSATGIDLINTVGSPQFTQISGNLYGIEFSNAQRMSSSGISRSLHRFLQYDLCTVIIRYSVDLSDASGVVFSNLAGSTTNNGYFWRGPDNGSSGKLTVILGSSGDQTVYSQESIDQVFTSSNTFYNVSLFTDPSFSTSATDESIAYVDNTLVSHFDNFGSIGTPSTIIDPAYDLSIGGQVTNTEYLDGIILEILVYNKHLNATEMNQIEDYLSNKWP